MGEPDILANLARGTIEKCTAQRTIQADEVLSWIGNNEARNTVEIWCRGKNIKLSPREEGPAEHANRLLQQDQDIIDTLSPYLRRIDLARLLTLRRYRTEDPNHQTVVYGNYRLLGEYLGPRRHYRREAQTPGLLPLPDLPPEIFDNQLIQDILFESEREAALLVFNRSHVEGFRYLNQLKISAQHEAQTEFIERLERHFQAVQDFTVPGFKTEIPGSQKDIPDQTSIELSTFPAFHQREYAYRFVNKAIGPVDYLVGDTGTMKTGGAIYAMEAAGANSTIVICPSGINKLLWEREIREKYDHPVEIVTIDSLKKLKELAARAPSRKPRYTIIGYQLLSRLDFGSSPDLLEKLANNLGVDSLIADEVHLAKEPTAECTQQLYMLSRTLSANAPRIVMTASAIVNSVEDLDAPVRTLLPHRYVNRGEFTRAARNDPDLVSAILRGDQILTRWTKEGLLTLPPVETRHEPVPLNPFHQALYEHVYLDSTIEDQVKRGMLRQVSLDPLLIRRHYNRYGIAALTADLRTKLDQRQDDIGRRIIEEKIRALEQRLGSVESLSNEITALQEISFAHETFKQWQQLNNNEGVFDEDFLVRMGHKDLALWAFFYLKGGVDELVKKSQDQNIRADWAGKSEVYSAKYLKLKELLDERILNGKTKVIIYSGFYQAGVSTGIEDISVDDELAFLSLYDHLRMWYGDDTFLKIDGSVSIEPKPGELAKREKVRRVWRLDPTKNLLATIRSSRLGIDLSVPKTQANSEIESVSNIFVDLPDTHMDIDQGIGRDNRPGQGFPIEVIFLRTTNPEQPRTFRYGYIDHGMWEAIEFKRLLSQMVLDGVPLAEDEERFLRSHLSNVRVELLPTTPNSYLTNVFYRQVRGLGARGVIDYYRQNGFEGMRNSDFFTANYPIHDQLSIAGHNARAVSEIVKAFESTSQTPASSIGSIGAGAGIFQLTLGRPVVNIDILTDILQVAKNRLADNGDFIAGVASALPIADNTFDVAEASFVLHWTDNRSEHRPDGSLSSERAKSVAELNRVTRIGGLVTFTLPPSYLTNRQFAAWKEVLETEFGFRFREDIRSGLMHATDLRQEAISWIFNLEKIADAQPNLRSVNALSFDFENVYDTLGARSRGGNSGPDIVSPAVPHTEFQIVEPGTGATQRLVYRQDLGNIEDIILSRPILPSDLDILASYGVEEFGTYRRAVREAKNRWGLSTEEAEQLAKEALIEGSNGDNGKDSSQEIWSEVRNIMEDIKEGKHK